MKGRSLFFALVIVTVAVGGSSASLDGVLETRLELDTQTTWIAASEPVAIRFTMTNTGADAVRVLRWQTPIDGIVHDLFAVALDGDPVVYTGMLAKRAAPQPEDYVEIAAGDSLTVVFDPTASYDMSRTGEYTVRYRTGLLDVLAGANHAKAAVAPWTAVASNEIAFWVEGLPTGLGNPARPAKGVDCEAKPCHPKCPPNPDLCGGGGGGGTGGAVEFVACSLQQQTKALTAVDNATILSRSSSDDLADGSSDLYQTWFGAYSSKNYRAVDGNFAAIADAFETQTVTINCTDADLGYYAYVYPSNPYEIFVCYYFFHAPNLGRDSAAGTLIHEMSHFNVVAATDDIVYGEAGALNLALTNPRKAIKNADNHEYFAEDH